ncbi:hypothetical protein L1887_29334 [Cichorium endivia]|nr:hypothetical protein L1887_29334 [Cichorium endivia]
MLSTVLKAFNTNVIILPFHTLELEFKQQCIKPYSFSIYKKCEEVLPLDISSTILIGMGKRLMSSFLEITSMVC